jgi:hypothetical protein
MRVIVPILFLLAATPAHAASYNQAKNAYDQGRIVEARSGFAAVIADAGAPAADRAAAERGLARLDWLVEGDADGAVRHLRDGIRLGADRCETQAMLARVLREAGRASEAASVAADMSGCTAGESDALLVQSAWARLDLLPASGDSRSTALAAIGTGLDSVSPLGRLGPDTNRLRLETALLQGNPGGALAAWRDYFWLPGTEDAPQAFRNEPIGARFAAGVGANATLADQCALLDTLVRAGFGRAAERFTAAHQLATRGRANPLCRKAQVYFTFRSSLNALTLDLYRRVARAGNADKVAMAKFGDEMGPKMTDLVGTTAAALDAITPRQQGDGTVGAVTDAFNLGASFGFTDNYPSVHLGHIIQNETRTVEQYGKKAEITFKLYDQMLSNGFESWLWDGDKATGGWSSGSVIVQVRGPYAESTVASTALVMDAKARQKADQRASERSRADPARLKEAEAAGHKAAYLPGLADRLKFEALDQIAAAVGGRDRADFAKRFAKREWDTTVGHSIWIHEGRHALDEAHFKAANFKPPELEYRAKLAEIMLADFPRTAFGSINDALVGEDSQHGIANTRIMEAYRDWIEAHQGQIKDYDRSAPALVQLDKLSDAQLRAVAAELADFDT